MAFISWVHYRPEPIPHHLTIPLQDLTAQIKIPTCRVHLPHTVCSIIRTIASNEAGQPSNQSGWLWLESEINFHLLFTCWVPHPNPFLIFMYFWKILREGRRGRGLDSGKTVVFLTFFFFTGAFFLFAPILSYSAFPPMRFTLIHDLVSFRHCVMKRVRHCLHTERMRNELAANNWFILIS